MPCQNGQKRGKNAFYHRAYQFKSVSEKYCLNIEDWWRAEKSETMLTRSLSHWHKNYNVQLLLKKEDQIVLLPLKSPIFVIFTKYHV